MRLKQYLLESKFTIYYKKKNDRKFQKAVEVNDYSAADMMKYQRQIAMDNQLQPGAINIIVVHNKSGQVFDYDFNLPGKKHPSYEKEFNKVIKVIKSAGFKLNEGQVVGFLAKKLEKLKKQHGYLSKSMLTKKELEQLRKAGHKISEDSELNELFYAMAAAIGGSKAAKKISPVAKSNPRINELIWKIHDHPLYDRHDEKKAVMAVIKDEKLDRKTAKYIRKLFRV